MRRVNDPEPTRVCSDIAYLVCFFLYARSASATVRMYPSATASDRERAGSPANCGLYGISLMEVTVVDAFAGGGGGVSCAIIVTDASASNTTHCALKPITLVPVPWFRRIP